MIYNFLTILTNFLNNHYVMLWIEASLIIFKIALFFPFLRKISQLSKNKAPAITLLIIIITSLIENLTWFSYICYKNFKFPSQNFTMGIICIGYATYLIMYYSFILFIQSFKINEKTNLKKNLNLIFFIITNLFLIPLLIFIIYAFFQDNGFVDLINYLTKYKIITFIVRYNLLVLMPYAIIEGISIIQSEPLPKILSEQVKTCIVYFLIPILLANIWQVFPIINTFSFHTEGLILSEIFLAFALFYFFKTIIGLRFLNVHSHVYDSKRFNFLYDFKIVLEELGQITNITEIKILSQQFFNKAFKIDQQKINLKIIFTPHSTEKDYFYKQHNLLQTTIENFITQANFEILSQSNNSENLIQILIYDEIAYTHFHEPSNFTQRLLTFLNDINADVFLPMYDQDRIIGYIIINKNSGRKKFYTNIERDEMIIFTTYAAKIVNLLQNRNLNELLKERKEITEELYTKHQEITRYKESLQSFIKINKGNSIGIILYKNKIFSFANEDANKILGINPNKEKGDPTTKLLLEMAEKIEKYKGPQLQFTKNIYNKRFVISGIPHPENTSVIFTVYYPELSDIVEELIDHINNPSNWDYLLYLETTESGKLINNLIPGNGSTLLNFKIELLKVALTKKALLINIPEKDIISMVELIHHISLKENLHILNLQAPITSKEIGISLFGINQLFAINSLTESAKEPLLEKLNKKGTLFIKNIHFLDLESQNNLATFIRYGFYKILKTERKMFSEVRIICSTNQNLEHLVKEGLFSEMLLKELRNTSLTLPTLLTLPTNEINTLIENFTEQSLNAENPTNKLLTLSEKDREILISQRPASLYDIKENIKNLLLAKSKKMDVYEETTFDAAYNISDPKLAEAARLGKHALKDPMIMAMLWNKFKNQNKIALFLGVNRSSIHRRCKDYGIL